MDRCGGLRAVHDAVLMVIYRKGERVRSNGQAAHAKHRIIADVGANALIRRAALPLA